MANAIKFSKVTAIPVAPCEPNTLFFLPLPGGEVFTLYMSSATGNSVHQIYSGTGTPMLPIDLLPDTTNIDYTPAGLIEFVEEIFGSTTLTHTPTYTNGEVSSIVVSDGVNTKEYFVIKDGSGNIVSVTTNLP